jgi:hypothetical protein
MLVGR